MNSKATSTLRSAFSSEPLPSSQGRTAVPTPNGSLKGFENVCQYTTENLRCSCIGLPPITSSAL